MSNKQHPKMLYRKGNIRGAHKLWNEPGVYYAVASDQDDEDAMVAEASFYLTVEDAKNHVDEPDVDSGEVAQDPDDLDRGALVAEAESLGIKTGKKSASKLLAEIEAKIAVGSDSDE